MSAGADTDQLKRLLAPYLNAMLEALSRDPHHIIIESGLALFIVWLLLIRRTVNPAMEAKSRLTTKETEWLIESWQPEPLVPYAEPVQLSIVERVDGNFLHVRGQDEPLLNLNTFDFLGFSRLPALKQASKEALEKYGCGSCGPRGFYGTIDLHLKFEQEIASFMGCEEAISYSDSASAVSSCLPAFAKKGDLLLVDCACHEAILTAAKLSRSTVVFFRHNDTADLRTILESIAEDDVALKRDSLQQRRFIVVEGLYRNTGSVCPLPELVALKNEFHYRLSVDESLSFGVLGQSGRGVTEHFGVSVHEVAVLTVAMDAALASVGGVCVGTREIVDHQRLAGAGYCFSAAAPPFLSAAALVSLHTLRTDRSAWQALQGVVARMAAELDQVAGLRRVSSDPTPVMHMCLAEKLEFSEERAVLAAMARRIERSGVAVSQLRFAAEDVKRMQGAGQRESLRFIAHAGLLPEELKRAVASVRTAVREVLQARTTGSLYPQ